MKEFFQMIVSNKEWLFDGIITEVVTLIIGGAIGFGVGMHFSGQQKQKAKDDAEQEQELTIENTIGKKDKNVKSFIRQKQKAGRNAIQIQTGRIKHGDK